MAKSVEVEREGGAFADVLAGLPASFALLVGMDTVPGCVRVLGCLACPCGTSVGSVAADEVGKAATTLSASLAAGVRFVGIAVSPDLEHSDSRVVGLVGAVGGGLVVSKRDGKPTATHIQADGACSEVGVVCVPMAKDDHHILSVRVTVSHHIAVCCKDGDFGTSVKEAVEGRVKSLTSQPLAFHCPQAQAIFTTKASTKGSALITREGGGKKDKDAAKKGGKKKKSQVALPGAHAEQVEMEHKSITLAMWTNASEQGSQPRAPSLYIAGDEAHTIHETYLTTHVIGLVHTQGLLAPMLDAVVHRTVAQLRAMAAQWAASPRALPTSQVFSVPETSLVLHTTYPIDGSLEDKNALLEHREQYLKSYREELHKLSFVPLTRPVFRTTNSIVASSKSLVTRLVNVHEGLAPSGVKNGKVFGIRGDYEYFHYMQDKFDDNGWGCAYRSLQTIISWFRLQQFTSVDIPSHLDIQRTLVRIGSRPKKFEKSKDWIGATELSEVLNDRLGVQSKIHFVQTGADLPSQAREIAHHFETQGTPIMMGGGMLAYTLLAIDWNELTGDVKFLILDPHFTGQDNLAVIQSKGWCGWKTEKLFDQNSFYNLCMPQLPRYY